MKVSTTIAAVSALAGGAMAALQPVTAKGNAFFVGNERFYVRGVDYQPGGSSNLVDPLASEETCSRDIAKFKELNINAVRIYTVDNTANHDACMKMLDDAGIYLILDVNSPKYSINRQDPHPSYNDKYLQNIFATMDMFSEYTNTMAFFSGNEVINETRASTECAPYVKAVTRDMKQYQGNRKLRKVLIGYSAADVESNRIQTANYFNCGTDDERSDFFAFNDYSWCDPSSFTTSGWDQKVKKFEDYGLPIFLSEHGCNAKMPRTFGDVKSLYGDDMTAVYSGGLVYEYSQEDSNYGLVNIKGGKVTERPDFANLAKAYKATPGPKGDGGYNKNGGKANKCPASSTNWLPDSDSLPSMPEGAKKYMTSGAGKAVGLEGPGSQNAGGASTGTATAGSGQPTSTASLESNGGAEQGSDDSAASGIEARPFVALVSVALSALLGAALL